MMVRRAADAMVMDHAWLMVGSCCESGEAGIIFGPGNSPIALFQKESALFSSNSFLLYPVHSIPTKSQFSPDRVMGG